LLINAPVIGIYLPTGFSHTELASHPHVMEVSVVARPHSKWGERPMAFVILHPQHARKWTGRHHEFGKDLKEHARTRLPGFACPEWVEVVPELPVSFMNIKPHRTRRLNPPTENFDGQDSQD
jgi:non-ribosomal peptide synthetase component E (peptide arylation enzyme)